MDFSALDFVGNICDNANSQPNRIYKKGLVVFICFNEILKMVYYINTVVHVVCLC